MSKVVMMFEDDGAKVAPMEEYVRVQIPAIWRTFAVVDRMFAEQRQENEAVRKDIESMKENIAHLAATVAALQRSLNTMAAELRGWEARR